MTMSFIRVVLKGLDIYFSTIPQISEGYVKINIIYRQCQFMS